MRRLSFRFRRRLARLLRVLRMVVLVLLILNREVKLDSR